MRRGLCLLAGIAITLARRPAGRCEGSSVSLSTPRTYAGRYTIRELVGEGSFSRTYAATDQVLQRQVALKLLRWEFAQDPAYATRFDREARAAARISHPNVIPVYDFGSEAGLPFIVMQFVDGPSLKEYVRDEGPLTIEEALDFARQILDGLGAIHTQQIVHRDVKPQNVMLDGKIAKLTDFGVAALPVEHGLTQTGMTVGTAAYMAPEQASGESVSAQADLYAVGVILYELLTGQLPFKGENPVQVMYRHVSEIPRPPRELNPYVPLALEAAVLKALSKAPVARYPDARTMRDALLFPGMSPHAPTVQTNQVAGPVAAVAGAASSTAVPRVPAADGPARPPTGRVPRQSGAGGRGGGRPPAARARRQPSRWPVFAALLLIAALSLTALTVAASQGLGLTGGDDDPPPSATTASVAGDPTATTQAESVVTEAPTATATLEPSATPAPPEPTATPPPPEPSATPEPPTPEPTATAEPEPTEDDDEGNGNGNDDSEPDNDLGVEFNQPFPLDSIPELWTAGASAQFGRDDFVAGGAYRRPDGVLYEREAAHLYAQGTDHPSTTVSFEAEDEPGSYIAIVITGMDDEWDENVPCRLVLNDEVVWEGASPFGDEQWTTTGWLAGNLGWLESGENSLTFEVLSEDGEFGQPPWILLNSATVYFG